jgi:hypothetical protein
VCLHLQRDVTSCHGEQVPSYSSFLIVHSSFNNSFFHLGMCIVAVTSTVPGWHQVLPERYRL